MFKLQADTGETICLFGPWQDPDNPAQLTEAGKKIAEWIAGKRDMVTTEDNALVRTEFQGQEKYRQSVRFMVRRVVDELRERTGDVREGLGEPVTTVDQFIEGIRLGKYEAYAHGSQLVMDIVNAATLEISKE